MIFYSERVSQAIFSFVAGMGWASENLGYMLCESLKEEKFNENIQYTNWPGIENPL